jgi:hypothetical protein
MQKYFLLLVITSIIACSSVNPESQETTETNLSVIPAIKKNTETNFPDWFNNPHSNNALVAAECVKFKGNISLTKTKAHTMALANIAAQIETSIVEVINSSVTMDNGKNTTNFKAKTIASVRQTLNGAKISKIEKATIYGKQHLCLQLSLEKVIFLENVKRLVSDPLSQKMLISGVELELDNQTDQTQ